jgi:hypothetical protein
VLLKQTADKKDTKQRVQKVYQMNNLKKKSCVLPVASVVCRQLFSGMLLLLCLLAVQTATAQPPIGVKLGMGWSTPVVTVASGGSGATYTPKNKDGIVLGLFTQLSLQAGWLFQPGVQYVSKGYGEHRVSSAYNYNFVINENLPYIEVPLNVLHASKPNGNGFLIGGGPAVGFLLERDYRYNGIKAMDVGVNLMMGYKVPVGFSLNLHYTYGLLDVSEKTAYVQALKNRFLALTVGYLF